MDRNKKLQATDQGERAFEEGLAIIDTLREAVDGRSTISLTAIATTLDVARERITTARIAFNQLSGT